MFSHYPGVVMLVVVPHWKTSPAPSTSDSQHLNTVLVYQDSLLRTSVVLYLYFRGPRVNTSACYPFLYQTDMKKTIATEISATITS